MPSLADADIQSDIFIYGLKPSLPMHGVYCTLGLARSIGHEYDQAPVAKMKFDTLLEPAMIPTSIQSHHTAETQFTWLSCGQLLLAPLHNKTWLHTLACLSMASEPNHKDVCTEL